MTDIELPEGLSNKNKKMIEGMITGGYFTQGHVDQIKLLAEILQKQGKQQDLLMPLHYVYNNHSAARELANAYHNKVVKKGEQVSRFCRFDPHWSSARMNDEYEKKNYYADLMGKLEKTNYQLVKLSDPRMHPKLRKFIPEHMWASQITNFHRLCIEGFKLSHCIGGDGYGKKGCNGMFAYLSIVLNGKRYTVEFQIVNGEVAMTHALSKNNEGITREDAVRLVQRFNIEENQRASTVTIVEKRYHKVKTKLLKVPEVFSKDISMFRRLKVAPSNLEVTEDMVPANVVFDIE